jgi:hypothetical protein
MRKVVILIIAICMAATWASADTSSDLYWEYKPYAETFGAPMFEMNGVSVLDAKKNTYQVYAGSLKMIFEITITNDIRTVLVCAEDDLCTADLMCACIAIISWLGETDFNAFGTMLSQFAMLRAGLKPAPGVVGNDAFNMVTREDCKYIFMYANNDLKAR